MLYILFDYLTLRSIHTRAGLLGGCLRRSGVQRPPWGSQTLARHCSSLPWAGFGPRCTWPIIGPFVTGCPSLTVISPPWLHTCSKKKFQFIKSSVCFHLVVSCLMGDEVPRRGDGAYTVAALPLGVNTGLVSNPESATFQCGDLKPCLHV